jgi:hypothetical protein
MNADKNSQRDQRDHSNGNDQNADRFHIAAGLCQHRGVSVAPHATLRNITGRCYLGLAETP